MKKLSQLLKSQFGNPSGFLGELAGYSMAFKNRKRIEWALEILEVKPNDKILEIGYGPGYSISLIADKLDEGVIMGVDHSPVMYKQACHRNEKAIRLKKAVIYKTDLASAKLHENYFNKILAINVHFFWTDPIKQILLIMNWLRPGGCIYFIFQHYNSKTLDEAKDKAYQLKELIIQAGLSIDRTLYKEMYPVIGIAIVACKRPKSIL